jgi:uncharacterized phage protein (TIGR02218 family)
VKALSAQQLEALADRATSLVTLWRITRRDATVVRLTDCDRAVVAGGHTYAPTGAIERSALRLRVGTAVENADCVGLFGEVVTRDDVLNGKYDGARVAVMVGFADQDIAPIPLALGTVGDIVIDDDRYVMQCNGLSQMLQTTVVEVTTPTCRAQLGDDRCRVSMSGWRHTYTVAAVTGDDQITVTGPSQLPGTATYANGVLEVLTGAAAGLKTEIRAWAGLTLTLYVAPLTLPAVGDSVRLTAGCNKTRATCRDVFANVVNFQGEPDVPGMDLLAAPAVEQS